MKESGPIIELMEKVSSGTLTVIFMKATGKTIKQMDMGSTNMQMGRSILENGKMICNTDEDKKLGPTAQSMKDNTMRVKSMEKEPISGLMVLHTQGVGLTIKFAGQVLTLGPMVGSTKANGATTICMVAASTLGLMVGVMKENTKMIRNMDLENTLGQMGVSTKVHGRMESNTVKVFTNTQMDILGRVSGNMEKEHNG